MGAGSPQLGALLAKLLVDVGSTFAAGNPQQEALGSILSDRIGGLVRAQAFNRSQALTQNAQSALRGPSVGPGLPATQANLDAGGGAFVSPDLAPGITTATGPVTQGAPGAPPAQIDPFQALALGQEGTQELIRTQQAQRLETKRGLERQQDFANRLTLLRKGQENRVEFARQQAEAAADLDEERGGPELRAAQLESAQATAGRATRTEAGAPTPEQLQEETALSLRGQRAKVLVDEAKQQLGTPEAVVDPSDLATTRRLAETAIAPKILSTLVERLGDTEQVQKLNTFFDTPANLLDESARRTNFTALVSLLEPNELRELQQDFGSILEEIRLGGQPFNVVGLGGTLGAPSATNPSIDPIGAASVADAVAGARDPNSLLRRNGR